MFAALTVPSVPCPRLYSVPMVTGATIEPSKTSQVFVVFASTICDIVALVSIQVPPDVWISVRVAVVSSQVATLPETLP